jgi:beta-glucosidase
MQTSKNARTAGPRWHKRVVIGLAAAGLILSGVGMSTLNAGVATPAKADTVLPYQDVSLSPAVRAADLVSRMTLEEKQAQLLASNPNFGGQAPAIPRLGVGAYSYWNEALHGVARDGGTVPDQTNMDAATKDMLGVATEFPTGLGIASSWNTALVRQESNVIAKEARAYWSDPQVNKTQVVANGMGGTTTYKDRRYGLTFWSPTVNLDRDPRWGRAEETYGEDPYLTGQIGTQFVEGVQQGDTSVANPKNYLAAVATTKHFFANNSEVNRHTGSADMSDSELRDYYTRQFRQ